MTEPCIHSWSQPTVRLTDHLDDDGNPIPEKPRTEFRYCLNCEHEQPVERAEK
jgi:hypothetical protein